MAHRHAFGILPVATLLAAMVVPLPARAGSIRGSASYRERIALPPDAVFEAVLIDGAIADAPARELGRVRLKPAGQPPFRFTIPYRDSDVTPRGRYAVRATVRQGERLLFTTDTFTPVQIGGASQPLSLQLVQVKRGGPPASSFPLGGLPASWRGDLPAASGTTRWQVDLATDGTDQLRQTFLNRPAPNSFDDIGRWRLEPGSRRLVLRGGREAPLFFQPLAGGAALQPLGLDGEPIRSLLPNRLRRLASPQPIDPRLLLRGMFRYLADAASIRLCATGTGLPVAMEGDFRRLEQAYLRALPSGGAGQPPLVNLEGLITSRPSPEPGRPPQRTLVVERFVGVHPGESCASVKAGSNPAPAAMAFPSLRGTVWRLAAPRWPAFACDGLRAELCGGPGPGAPLEHRQTEPAAPGRARPHVAAVQARHARWLGCPWRASHRHEPRDPDPISPATPVWPVRQGKPVLWSTPLGLRRFPPLGRIRCSPRSKGW